ncbi:2-oxoglutarate and iron-dependent oxygenase domain-containing protein 2 isoform X1 [Oopsacas minuta]|uniref:2-oxoglutarate and iron-dependent oxygenase domain-containing protein 2 isoform X1 n=1 Tax=Oopsacas minuta TaxID=111878 RepID=A0AAV7KF21_9METZ|nr:2-oxoglutarate and iron-dependent oxygenase domain-containing protein 2 isoform X1 [Oopsacas minuta]
MSHLKTKKFYVCSCFFYKNIFLKDYALHVEYEGDDKFIAQYESVFTQKYSVNLEKLKQEIIPFVRAEIDKRRDRGKLCLERCMYIEQNYKPLHTQVYTLDPRFLEPAFIQIVNYCKSAGSTKEGLLSLIKKEAPGRSYSFPVFTNEFCKLLVEELEYFEASPMPKDRPNTMNNFGLLLSEVGFDLRFMDPWRIEYLVPISRLLYPDCCGGSLDSHRVFIVRYKLGEDLDLATHFDNAEVTINVSIGDVFEGGDLYFGRMSQDGTAGLPKDYKWYKHINGTGLVHRGLQFHGAAPITSGTRYNLIMWMRSSQLRNKLCPMCNSAPQLEESIGYGDGFML